MTKHYSKFSGDKFWQDILANEPPQDQLPVVTTDHLVMHFNTTATIDGTVVSGPVTEYGFVWATHDNPTIDDHVIIVGDEDFTGEFENTTTGGALPLFTVVYFAAYATNTVGTVYGDVLSGEVEICLMAGTPITLADGTKRNIEDIEYDDELLVWNFDKGMSGTAKPVWIVEPFTSSRYSLVTFSDGSQLGTIADGRGHRIFNIDKQMFTHMMSDDTPIGTKTYNEYGDIVSVIRKEVIEEEMTFHNIITERHFNLYADSILTSTGLNNIYPIAEMKFVKDNRSGRSRTDFPGVPARLFTGLRLSEQSQSYPDLQTKIARLVRRQKHEARHLVSSF